MVNKISISIKESSSFEHEVQKVKRNSKSPTLKRIEISAHEAFHSMKTSTSRRLAFIKDLSSLIKSGLIATIKFITLSLINKIKEIVYKILHIKISDEYSLIKSKTVVPDSKKAWSLNLALLHHAYETTDDPELKDKIRFMGNNYLSKSAPVFLKLMKFLSSKFEKIFQVGVYKSPHYHRMAFRHKIDVSAPINANYALSKTSPLILTDGGNYQKLFPLNFQVISGSDEPTQWSEHIHKALTEHFSKFEDQSHKGIHQALQNSLLFDLTDSLQHLIKTNGDKNKEIIFKKELKKFKSHLNKAILDSIEKIKNDQPDIYKSLGRKKLENFAKKNMTTICRVDEEPIAGIKVLPVFTNLDGDKILTRHTAFLDFIDFSGIYMGAVNMRRYVFNDFDKNSDIEYAVRGNNSIYFNDPSDLTNTALVTRLSQTFTSEEFSKKNPHLSVLGMATLEIFQGLISEMEISGKWEEFKENPAINEIVQTTLYKILNELATAEMQIQDYKKFAQSIELVHAEMANLMELFSPFEQEDFSEIYQENLTEIPPSLMPYVKASLGRTAVNNFAWINQAVAFNQPNPVRVYSKGFYYEQAAFIGHDYTFEDALNNPDIKEINLYSGQFNPNVEIESHHTQYQVRDIENDIREIFLKKPDTKHLTVAIDCTTDYYNSPRVKHLLEVFEEEIIQGQINFVFFRSGQKFDMLGMDNYYGAPFYMVNNNAPHWDSFTTLTEEKALKTDSLSLQWFCLANRYASDQLDAYRKLIFQNAKTILNHIPKSLKPNKKNLNKGIRISDVDSEMDPSFIDIKVIGKHHKLNGYNLVGLFYKTLMQEGIKVHSKASFGFYHANINLIMVNAEEGSSTLRINPGLNPEENNAIIKYISKLTKYIST